MNYPHYILIKGLLILTEINYSTYAVEDKIYDSNKFLKKSLLDPFIYGDHIDLRKKH